MSNALAIAAVTAVLKDLLNNGIIAHDLTGAIGEVKVSTQPPDRVLSAATPAEPTQLNLFLYHVSANPGWRNAALPSRDGRGDRVTNPPLALDLHYLLTAYGDQPFHAEILLGYAMQLMHETPVLTRGAIRTALKPTSPVDGVILPPGFKALAAAELADQVEMIKITPHFLSTEELSKLWTSFQTVYRPTVAYQVSVILIESQASTRASLPVRERNIKVVTFRHSVIESVAPQLALPGDKLVIRGQSLSGKPIQVNFGDLSVAPDSVSDSQIEVTLPAGLLAGVNALQILYDIDFSTNKEPHRGFQSNVAAFVLRPTIKKNLGNYLINVAGPPADPDGFRSGTITPTFDLPIRKTQHVTLLLNELNPPDTRPARAYSFDAPSRTLPPPADNTTTDTAIDIPFSRVRQGQYLVRVQVDGATSPLDSAPGGGYVTPAVTI